MNSYREIPGLSEAKRDLLQQLVDQLHRVPGVAAIVLGGSHATGAQHAASDLDIGIYYWEAHPFAIPAIQAIANRLSVQGPPTVTDFYGWGAWVNGGAWIQTAQSKRDL